MIAKSDFFILLLSIGVLGVGIWHWQQNLAAHNASRERENTPSAGAGNNVQQRGSMPPSAVKAPPTASGTGSSSTLPANQTANQAANEPASAPASSTATDNGMSTTELQPTSSDSSATSGESPGTTDTEAGLDTTTTEFGYHTVEPGDYLLLIADRYNTTVKELQTLNNLESTVIKVGQQIRYPL